MRSEIDDIQATVRIAGKVDLDTLSGPELGEAVELLDRAGAALDALRTKVVGAFDRSKAWVGDGHKSAAAAVAARTGERRGRARDQVELARKLEEMPATADALESGEVSADRAQRLGKAQARLPEAFADDEETLVSVAKESSHREFAHAVSCWEALNDRAGEEERARRVIADRDAHVTTATDGVTYVSGQLPFVAGAEFKAEFDRLEQQLFKADWAEARERLGDQATADDLVRTPAQRRADALVEMARRSARTDTDSDDGAAPPARTVVNLIMDWETFCAELALHEHQTGVPYPPGGTSEFEDQTPLPPSLGLDAGLGGEIRRIVMGAQGEILDFGRKKRLFTGALREALILRDRVCQHPGCEVPARKCEGDHVTPWAQGGVTSEHNGQIRCDYHNRWKSGVTTKRKRGPPA